MFKRGENIMIITGSHTGSKGVILFWEDADKYKVRLQNGDTISVAQGAMQISR